MMGLWMSGLGPSMHAPGPPQTGAVRATNMAFQAQTAIRDLEHQVQRLSLLSQAMWEILRDKTKLTDADLENMARDIDLRDGMEDEKISTHPVRCPACKRVSNSKHYKCIYCSQEFERPIFG